MTAQMRIDASPLGGAATSFAPYEQTAAYAMPGIDGARPDLLVVNGCTYGVMLRFGTLSTIAVGPGNGIDVIVGGGETALITASSTVAAAAPASANVFVCGAVSSATYVAAACVQLRGGSLTVTRTAASVVVGF